MKFWTITNLENQEGTEDSNIQLKLIYVFIAIILCPS